MKAEATASTLTALSFFIKEKTRYKYWHLPIFTPRRQGTIFGTTELNFRVRDGNGWTLCVIDTNLIVADFMAPPTGLEPVTS